MVFEKLFKSTPALTEFRGIHFDLKGLPPRPERMIQLLRLFAEAKYNVVLMEWEDTFPWKVDESFRSPNAYKPEDIKRFGEVCNELGMELIPKVQCLGHMETPLGVSVNKHLREISDDSSGLNPLAEGARDLVQSMVDDVLELLPDVKYFHLGGDEAWTFGSHPDTKAYIEKHSKGELYLQYVEPLLQNLNDRGIRPMLWHDMMIKWGDEQLKDIGKKCDIMLWGYSQKPTETDYDHSVRYIERFHKNGVTLWGASAIKGADARNTDMPNLEMREENTLGWTEISETYSFKGIVAASWNRYSVCEVQCEPVDAILDQAVHMGAILYSGKIHEDQWEEIKSGLIELGEQEGLELRQVEMKELTKLRKDAWGEIQYLYEQIQLYKADPERRTSNLKMARCLERVQELIAKGDSLSERVRRDFKDALYSDSIEEYLDTRLTPIKEQYEICSEKLGLEVKK